MPWPLLRCERCGVEFRHPGVGEIERWMRTRANPSLLAEPAHWARQAKQLSALCPGCREVSRGMPFVPSLSVCRTCGSRGLDRQRRCRGCGSPPSDMTSRVFTGRPGGAADRDD